MTARYTEEVSIKFARAWLKAYFDGVRIPHGSRVLWLAGLQYISDQPGLYVTSGAGGLSGVLIVPPATEAAERKAS